MKCPLWFVGRTAVIPREDAGIGECLWADCAWWDKLTERCCFAELAVQLRSVNANLVRFSQNMTLR